MGVGVLQFVNEKRLILTMSGIFLPTKTNVTQKHLCERTKSNGFRTIRGRVVYINNIYVRSIVYVHMSIQVGNRLAVVY